MKQAGSKDAFYQVDYTYPMSLARIALKNQSQVFNLVSSIGANEKSLFYYSRVKGEIESSISNIGIKQVNIFRPSLLLGKREESRLGENFGGAIGKFLTPLIMKKYRPIEAAVVARALITASSVQNPGINIYESDVMANPAFLQNNK